MLSASVFLALAIHCSPGVHPDTARDIARVESGYNPYAIGVVGEKGIFPASLSEALTHVDRLKAQGKNYSVGLMQINQSNFGSKSPRQLFNPCINLSVFEKLMIDCYRRGGTLTRALSCYYSGNFVTGQKPEKQFDGTSYTERIGYTPSANYIVPSTKKDQQQASALTHQKPGHLIKWPDSIVRGDLYAPEGSTSTKIIYYPHRIIRGELSTSQ